MAGRDSKKIHGFLSDTALGSSCCCQAQQRNTYFSHFSPTSATSALLLKHYSPTSATSSLLQPLQLLQLRQLLQPTSETLQPYFRNTSASYFSQHFAIGVLKTIFQPASETYFSPTSALLQKHFSHLLQPFQATCTRTISNSHITMHCATVSSH